MIRITNTCLLDESESHILALKVVYHVHCVQSSISSQITKTATKLIKTLPENEGISYQAYGQGNT